MKQFGKSIIYKTTIMDIKSIQKELNKIQESSYAKKTDKQLISYDLLSQLHNHKNKGVQPPELVKFNNPVNRQCKLNIQKVREIRKKYNCHVYGKLKLAKEYGVSPSVIYRIVNGKSWKEKQIPP